MFDWVNTQRCSLLADATLSISLSITAHMSSKLEALLEKERKLKAQIQQAKAAERTLEKKRDTRRKILIGAAVMARVNRGEWPESELKQMMDGFLTRPQERELFDLDDVAVATASSPEPKTAAVRDQSPRHTPSGQRLPESIPNASLASFDHDEFDL